MKPERILAGSAVFPVHREPLAISTVSGVVSTLATTPSTSPMTCACEKEVQAEVLGAGRFGDAASSAIGMLAGSRPASPRRAAGHRAAGRPSRLTLASSSIPSTRPRFASWQRRELVDRGQEVQWPRQPLSSAPPLGVPGGCRSSHGTRRYAFAGDPPSLLLGSIRGRPNPRRSQSPPRRCPAHENPSEDGTDWTPASPGEPCRRSPLVARLGRASSCPPSTDLPAHPTSSRFPEPLFVSIVSSRFRVHLTRVRAVNPFWRRRAGLMDVRPQQRDHPADGEHERFVGRFTGEHWVSSSFASSAGVSWARAKIADVLALAVVRRPRHREPGSTALEVRPSVLRVRAPSGIPGTLDEGRRRRAAVRGCTSVTAIEALPRDSALTRAVSRISVNAGLSVQLVPRLPGERCGLSTRIGIPIAELAASPHRPGPSPRPCTLLPLRLQVHALSKSSHARTTPATVESPWLRRCLGKTADPRQDRSGLSSTRPGAVPGLRGADLQDGSATSDAIDAGIRLGSDTRCLPLSSLRSRLSRFCSTPSATLSTTSSKSNLEYSAPAVC